MEERGLHSVIVYPKLALSKREVAVVLGVKEDTIDHLVERGRLPAGRRWRNWQFWIAKELEEALTQFERAAQDDKWKAEL
jgi:excisionase family DNA binding protein